MSFANVFWKDFPIFNWDLPEIVFSLPENLTKIKWFTAEKNYHSTHEISIYTFKWKTGLLIAN